MISLFYSYFYWLQNFNDVADPEDAFNRLKESSAPEPNEKPVKTEVKKPKKVIFLIFLLSEKIVQAQHGYNLT